MRVQTKSEIAIIQDNAPEVFEMVEYARKNKVGMVITTIDAFAYEPDLLHAVIWYYTSQGLDVVFARGKK